MRNVALNGKRSLLICMNSAKFRVIESANKHMQSDAAELCQPLSGFAALGRLAQ
jgi:hypothetical protein